MAVVADVDTELAKGRLEDGPVGVAGFEKELLPKAGNLGDMGLAVLAQIAAVGVDHRRGIVVEPGHDLFIDRHDDHHTVLLSGLLHQPRGVAVRNRFGGRVPLFVLARAEIGLGEDLLKAEDLHALLGRLLDEGDMGFQHGVANHLRRLLRARL